MLWHQFLSICPVVGLVPFQSGPTYIEVRYYQQNKAHTSYSLLESFCIWCSTYLSLLAYECCRVKSKSFSRFLLCSLLQASSSPRFSSSPSSSSLFWVFVGCGEQVCASNCKSRFLSLWKFAFKKRKYIFPWAVLHWITHTGAGSERAGGVLTLMVGVTADNCHLHPHWLTWGSEVKPYSVC